MLFLIVTTLLSYHINNIACSGMVCDSKYMSTVQCHVEYGTQLTAKYKRSIIECTQECSTLSGCRSVFYDSANKLCRTNSATLTSSIPCSNPTNYILYFEFTENSCRSPSSMKTSCASSTDCDDVLNAECRDGMCKCTVGYSYHDGTRQCFSDCGHHGYGSTYQEILGVIMIGFFNYNFLPMSADGCKDLCINETRFVCRTAEAYVTNNGVDGCQLSWETFNTNPEAYNERPGSVTYIRDCS